MIKTLLDAIAALFWQVQLSLILKVFQHSTCDFEYSTTITQEYYAQMRTDSSTH